MDARNDIDDETGSLIGRLVRFASPALIPLIVVLILVIVHWIEIVVGPIRRR